MEKNFYLKIFQIFQYHPTTKIHSIVIEILNVFDRLKKEYEIQMIIVEINVLFDKHLVRLDLNEPKISFQIKTKKYLFSSYSWIICISRFINSF